MKCLGLSALGFTSDFDDEKIKEGENIVKSERQRREKDEKSGKGDNETKGGIRGL